MKINEIFRPKILTEGYSFKFQVPATITQLARDIPGVKVRHANKDLWVLTYAGQELEIVVSEGGWILWGVWRADSLPDYATEWNTLQQKIIQHYGKDAEIDVESEEGGFPWDEDDEADEIHHL